MQLVSTTTNMTITKNIGQGSLMEMPTKKNKNANICGVWKLKFSRIENVGHKYGVSKPMLYL